MTDNGTDYDSAVALIGMSGRFPGAGSVGELWGNLLAGVKGLRAITDEELREAGVEPGKLADPRYVRVGGPLDGLDRFDATVFGINPREAETMDPQHRLFLECSWEALEAAGYCPTDVPGQVAVFGGCGFPDYIVQNIQHLTTQPGGALLMAVGNERDSLASLVSYKLGLRGPAVSVQTFCSTSLVSVHLACQSLLTYECDIAVAGGAFTPLPQPSGYLYEQGGIMSPDGRVRSFDAEASGTVMGSGAGVVALKRMSDALADGDVIHAVILGSAANNDGRLRAGYTAPGVDGQAEVIESALGVAGVKPDTVGYVECHATGTMLGDSIELAAMNRVFAQTRETPCVLGSLKPSLGHLDRASGVTGLMRAAMTLKHELLPGTPGYETPNPALAGAQDRFTVLTENRPWAAGPHPRRAGVSSFGLGGTNAHVVLEQAPPRPARPARPGPHLLVLSAADEQALTDVTERLRAHLAEEAGEDVADVAFTLQVSRGGFALRRAVVCRDRADAVAALGDPSRWIGGKTQRRNPRVRLSVPDAEAPAAWGAELRAAVDTVLRPGAGGEKVLRPGAGGEKVLRPGATGPQATGGDREQAVAALADGLGGVGVHMVKGEPSGPATGQVSGQGSGQVSGQVEEVVVAPDGDTPAAEWLLATLARLWLAGAAVDWPALHGGQGRRVELPTYPFQRRRFWIKPNPAAQAQGQQQGPGKSFDRGRWTYLPTWRPHPLPLAGLDDRLRLAGPWLVFTGDARGEALVERLTRAGAEVTAVRAGDRFGQDDDGDFTIRPGKADDMAELFYSLVAAPRAIVHGFSLASPEAGPEADPVRHFTAEQARGFYSALALARELVDNTGSAPRAELVLLTSHAVSVSGADLRHPEHSTLAALAPSLQQENPRLRCRHVDVDGAGGDVAPAEDALAEQVLAAAVCPHEGPVALRAGETWLREYRQYPVDEPGPDERGFRDGDTVLVTGGLGDVGLVLARHLASTYGCRLVLTARSALPPREEWDAFLAAAPPGSERTVRHIRNIRDLESRGATVLALSADVADEEAMRAVVAEAVSRFGGIDVVVHGAGVQDGAYFNFAHLMDRQQCDAHLAAKVTGFHVLQKVLGEHAGGRVPDRRITLSSIAAVLGGMTLAPYAAANAALDAYVRAARTAGAGRWVTVDWDTWNIDPDRVAGHSGAVIDYAMTPAEGVDVLERALSAADRAGHFVISTGPLEARLAQWVTGDIHEAGDDDDDQERHPRPELNNAYVEPREGTEATLAAIWSRVLGIEPIGALDNFFELGGHSLLAIELTTRVRKQLNASVPVTGLLECPTVRQLAELLDTRDGQE
ncbi:SDR family NAD(P)-dependent oxidoreductase [Nonomuraea sp. 3-1Str]|uniref:type I polyketide synthase n=1 Tax=Nonomuraea sp. 3-1Str TaxID=2929801 RepID=UPI0028549742|nr:SDR family NAD(P)-dependent oxidoreductase [Nonomuraea sp. 3-1Str]MDR8412941.1 SDR family NAD(P)-dependent oxidoreductase [Nonomuraea sp. 3-1Str]